MQTLISMAAGTSARQGRFRASLLLWIAFALTVFGCSEGTSNQELAWKELSDENLSLVNGMMYYEDESYTGSVLGFYPSTNDTSEVAHYLAGKEDGLWRKYYEDRQLMEERLYDRGKKTGDYLSWWPNGNKKLHFRFFNDEYEGTCREWNEDGRLVQEMNYRNGHEEGSQKMYYDNGKIRSNYTIIAGRRYGLLGTKNCVNVADSVFVD